MMDFEYKAAVVEVSHMLSPLKAIFPTAMDREFL